MLESTAKAQPPEAASSAEHLSPLPASYEFAQLAAWHLPQESIYSPGAILAYTEHIRKFASRPNSGIKPQIGREPNELGVMEWLSDHQRELVERVGAERVVTCVEYAVSNAMTEARVTTEGHRRTHDFSGFDIDLCRGMTTVMLGDMLRLERFGFSKLPQLVRYNSAEYIESLMAEQRTCELPPATYRNIVNKNSKRPKKGVMKVLRSIEELKKGSAKYGIGLSKTNLIKAATAGLEPTKVLDNIRDLSGDYKDHEYVTRGLVKLYSVSGSEPAKKLGELCQAVDGLLEIQEQEGEDGVLANFTPQQLAQEYRKRPGKYIDMLWAAAAARGRLDQQYRGNKNFTNGVKNHIARSQDPELTAQRYSRVLASLERVNATNSVRVSEPTLRALALGGRELTGEELLFEGRVIELRKVNGMQGMAEWLPRLIAKAHPMTTSSLREAGMALRGADSLLQAGLLQSITLEQAPQNGELVDEVTCRIVHFTYMLDELEVSQRQLIAHAFGVDMLLFGEDLGRAVRQNYGEDWRTYFKEEMHPALVRLAKGPVPWHGRPGVVHRQTPLARVGIERIVALKPEDAAPPRPEKASGADEKPAAAAEAATTPKLTARKLGESATAIKNSLGLYLDAMGRHSILVPAEVSEVARGIEAGVFAARKLETQDFTSASAEELEEIVRQGKRDEERLTYANLRLVLRMVERYAKPGSPIHLDLVQEGNLGLVRAVKEYDYTKNATFSTFAWWKIKNAIDEYFIDRGRTIRVPANVTREITKLTWAEKAHGPGVADEVLAEELGTSTARLTELRRWRARPLSLQQPIGSGDTQELGDLLVIGDAGEASVGATFLTGPKASTTKRTQVEELLAMVKANGKPLVKERDASLLRELFGLVDGNSKTMEELAVTHGISPARVRTLKYTTLKRIREAATQNAVEDAVEAQE